MPLTTEQKCDFMLTLIVQFGNNLTIDNETINRLLLNYDKIVKKLEEDKE